VRAWPIVLALGLSACGGIPSYASSVFEADDEGWSIGNNGSDTKPTLDRSGGNPGGTICGQDHADGDIWYFVAPPKFLGDASGTYGKRLTFDLRQGSIYDQIRGRDVVLNGGGLAVINNLRFAPGLDWTPYSFWIDDVSGWSIDDQTGTGPLATAAQLKTVLGSLTSLRIRGEFFDGPLDTACLDNVYFGRP
jgi:Laminin B (Domain IV)